MSGSGFDGFFRDAKSEELPWREAKARTEAEAKNFFLFIDERDRIFFIN